MPLLEELYELSPNSDLLKSLRDSGELPPPSRGDDSVLGRTRDQLLELFGSGTTEGLGGLILSPRSSENDKVLICGECIMALRATPDADKKALLREVLRPFLQVAPDEEIGIRARREWLCILLDELQDNLTPEKSLNLRYVVASCTDTCRPGLVGESFYLLGRAAAEAGDTTKARQCFESVRMDMRNNLVGERPSNLRFEVYGALYWYQQACEELMQMVAAEERVVIRNELDQIRQKFSGVTLQPSGPMIGPIARTYLAREQYLTKMLKEIRATAGMDRELEPVCYRYDYCHDIDTYLFAMERHRMVLPIIPAGVQLTYDPPVQEALDILKAMDEVEGH